MTKSLHKELLRKLFHLMEVPVVVGYTYFRYRFGERVGILAVTAVFLGLMFAEYLRLEYPGKIPDFVKDIFRSREKDNVTGTIFFIAATIIVFAAFDYSIAVLALLLTVFGDFFSALVGIKFGKTIMHGEKTRAGFFAGLAINLVVGYLVMPTLPLVFIPMAVMASIVEVMTGKLDDNLTVPIIAAFTGHMIVYMLQVQIPPFPGVVMEGVLRFLGAV